MKFSDEIEQMSVCDLFSNGTMEMYHGGFYPDESTFTGQCWLKLYNSSNIPGERTIDWNLFADDIEDIIDALNHYGSDKNHKYYKFLQEKLRLARLKEKAILREDLDYSDLEITALSLEINGNRLELPKELHLSNYKDLKELMKNFGGKYSKNGFSFDYEPEDVLERIRNKNTDNLKKKYQFFGTPKKIADQLCEMTFDPMLNKKVKILEPSAGQGSIIDSIWDWFENKAVNISIEKFTAIELMKENYNFLENNYNTDEAGLNLLNMDFLQYDEYINYFDFVIANPPFTKGQDIEHFYKMYEVCKPGGIITSIMSTSWIHNSNKKSKDFRKWLGMDEDKNWNEIIMKKSAAKGHADYNSFRYGSNQNEEQVSIKTFEAGAFSESGTNVITCVVQIRKNNLSGFGSEFGQLQFF